MRSYGRDSLVCCALALPLIIYFAGGCTARDATRDEVIRPVKTMVVTAGEGTRVRIFPGRAEAARKAELAFQVPGLVVNLPIKEGQKVAKGEVIAQLRQEEFDARLKTVQGQHEQAQATLSALLAGERPEERLRREAQLRAAEARLENARADFGRYERLVQSRAISRQAFEAAEAAYRVAQEDFAAARQTLEKGTIAREEDIEARKAEVRSLEGRVVEAHLQLEDTTLRAPYDGVIAQRFIEEQQNVQAKQPVVRFQDVDEIDIVVDVPEAVMSADIRSADITQMVAEFSGAPGIEFPVEIKEVAQVADPTTQTFAVRVAMRAPDQVTILPGMTARVTATYHRADILGHRVLVPISAVFKTPDGEQVTWIVGSDGAVSRRLVKLGEATGGQIEIVEGLHPGERIAVAGVNFLREGMKVRDLGDEWGGSQP